MSKQVECQNGHKFDVGEAAQLPHRCPRCQAPARPARPFGKTPPSGRYGEPEYVTRVG